MPRAPRVVEPGGIYHLTPRGNNGREIFLKDADRKDFLLRLEFTVSRFAWIVYGYCLMDNHVHLLVEVPECGLSEGMQELLGGYSQARNKRYGHFGHLFVNRFNGKPVRDDSHLLSTTRYIDLNPVAAGMKERPEQWKWSSYRAHVGLDHPARFLANAEFLKLFGSTPDGARKAYRRFVAEGLEAGSDTGLSAES
jgi:putative transposase